MPAFLAHYTSGVLAQHRVFDFRPDQSAPGKLQQSLEAYPNVFHVGLAGPDIFFYAVHALLFQEMTLGRQMHKYRTGQFLKALYDCAMNEQGRDQLIAISYFAGFLGHYCQDTSSHPLIYQICDHPDEMVALGKHFRFEAAMDVRCIRHYLGRDIHHAHQMGLIRLRHHEQKIIAKVLSKALGIAYPDAPCGTSKISLRMTLQEYMWISNLLIDPTGFKEWIVYHIEKKALGYPLLSSLLVNNHLYGTTEEQWQQFNRRFKRGEQYFEKLLPLLAEAVEKPNETEKEKQLFRLIGSRSYHTGRHEDGALMEINW